MLESRNDGKVVNANFNSNGNLNVNWNLKSDNHNPNLGGRSSVVGSCYLKESLLILKIFSSHQAFCLFLAGLALAGDIFYYLELVYLWLALLVS